MDAHVTIGALHRNAIKGMIFLDENIFNYKHHIIWGMCFLFTVSFPIEPALVGVIGGVCAFAFSKYLDKKGIFADEKLKRIKDIEIQVAESIALLELEKKKAEIEQIKNETEISNLNVIDHKSKVEHSIAARFRDTDGHGNPIDNDGNNIF